MTPSEIQTLIENAKLTRQSYGLQMAQCTFGGPKGIWLECKGCLESQTIVGSGPADIWGQVSDEQAALVFIRHGWTGEGPILLKAKCPKCSQSSPNH